MKSFVKEHSYISYTCVFTRNLFLLVVRAKMQQYSFKQDLTPLGKLNQQTLMRISHRHLYLLSLYAEFSDVEIPATTNLIMHIFCSGSFIYLIDQERWGKVNSKIGSHSHLRRNYKHLITVVPYIFLVCVAEYLISANHKSYLLICYC